MTASSVSGNSVFLVHGRDLAIRNAVARLLEDHGLSVIDWEGAIALTGRAAPHAREVLEAALRMVKAVIILFTGDDEARLRSHYCRTEEFDIEGTLAPQPRANVIFEAGLAFAMFPTQTIVLQVGRLRPLSDLAGVQFVPLDESDASRRSLLNRLRVAGCRIGQPSTTENHDLPSSRDGLPEPTPSSSDSIALLRRARSFFFGARFGPALDIAERARIGEDLVVSVRSPFSDGDYRLLHWTPGSSRPQSIQLKYPDKPGDPLSMALPVTGPPGIHIIDLLSERNGTAQVVARTQCIVDEP
jgi:hypothetical protein